MFPSRGRRFSTPPDGLRRVLKHPEAAFVVYVVEKTFIGALGVAV